MDLTEILKNKIDNLENGEFSIGLKAVINHLLNAEKHFVRGQNSDDSAFTDVIYRTNQVYEGIVKEAYRVLTDKDPSGQSTYEIEQYLTGNNILKPRVLELFTNYRKNWRNPSTHDYNLNFDANEALLAISSVSAFGVIILDQISGYLAFLKSKEEALQNNAQFSKLLISNKNDDITNKISLLLKDFCDNHYPNFFKVSPMTEYEFLSALEGYLSGVLNDFEIQTDTYFNDALRFKGDLVIRKDDQSVLIEVKRFLINLDLAIEQVSTYLENSELNGGIILLMPIDKTKVKLSQRQLQSGKLISLLIPEQEESR